MKNFMSISVAIVATILLSACGGGEGGPSTPTEVLKVTATQFDCTYQSDDLVIGEVGRSVVCFYVISSGDAMITEIPITMTSSAAGLAAGLGDGVITRVNLTTESDKGRQMLTEATGFTFGKLTLRGNILLTANQPVVMALRVSVEMPGKLAYLPVDAKAGLQMGTLAVKYDQAKYASASKTVAMTFVDRPVRYVEPIAISSSTGGVDFVPGVTSAWLGNFTLTNPAKADKVISASHLGFYGGFQGADGFVANCFTNLRVVSLQGEVVVGTVGVGNILQTPFRVPAGKAVTVSVFADTGNCSASQLGSTISISLQVLGTYEGMTLREEWQGYGEAIIRIPVSEKG